MPLVVVSARSGTRGSMPGIMGTILNLGINDTTALSLAAATKNEHFALIRSTRSAGLSDNKKIATSVNW